MQAVMSIEEMQAYLDEVFPQIKGSFLLDHLDGKTTVMRLRVEDQHLRPGGTVSGPTMFALADVSAYVATLACVGRKALAVTTHCSIDFMRKPVADRDLVATAELLKLGRSLSVVSVSLRSEGQEGLVAHASLTYSIPPEKS
ncbi:MAG: PaaI family thioesterase [Pseudomonadota bacterium]|nr:PaaI family thioesterase [Pseudomonadota bacterium]